LYAEAVPVEGFTSSIAHETTTHGGDEPPPLAESVSAMRRFLQTIP
jgi:hypothetical protein